MSTLRTLAAASAGAAALLAAACSQADTPEATTAEAMPAEASAAADAAAPAAATATSGDVVAVAMGSPDHTTLVTAVKAADLAGTLQGSGPFTVFAPTNAAFGKLPAGTVESLTQPAQKSQLTKILTYHVVPGRLTAADIASQAQANGGTATLTTVEGSPLKVSDAGGGAWRITDEKGGTAMITAADLGASNGVIHVIDTVLMPN